MAPAPTSPATWVFAPACSATAVREPLVLTGNPWNRPAARFAVPIPISSWLPSISWPVRAANEDAVEIVSVSDTSAMPSAPSASAPRSPSETVGIVNGGNPCGNAPTSDTPRDSRSKIAASAIEMTTTSSTPGSLGSTRSKTTISTSPSAPIANAAVTVSPLATPRRNPVSSSMNPSASTENPNSFGNWPTRIVTASPFM